MRKSESHDNIKLMKRLKGGLLEIRGKGIVKKYSWKTRYFILTEKSSIVYYSIDVLNREKYYKGFISLKQCKIRILDKKKGCFAIDDRGKEYVLRCRNYEEMKDWVRLIRNATFTLNSQRQTNFQSFKPISFTGDSVRDRNDSIEDFINENFLPSFETIEEGYEHVGYDGTLQYVNPYFLNDDIDDLPEYMKGMHHKKTSIKAIFANVQIKVLNKDLDFLDDFDSFKLKESHGLSVPSIAEENGEEGESFDVRIVITTDIMAILDDLNIPNYFVKRTSLPRLGKMEEGDGKDKRKKRKNSNPKKPRRRKVWSGELTPPF